MEIEQSLGYLLNVSARLMKREMDALLRGHGITTTQWAALKLLAAPGARGGLSQAEIAARTHADRATCGAVLDTLIGKDLLAKELSASDRRSYRVSILPAGLALVRQLSPLAQQVNRAAAAGLSRQEAGTLALCLEKIIARLDGAASAAKTEPGAAQEEEENTDATRS